MSSAEATTTPSLQGLLDAFNAHDLDAILSLFTEDCSLRRAARAGPGRAPVRRQGSGPEGIHALRRDPGCRLDRRPPLLERRSRGSRVDDPRDPVDGRAHRGARVRPLRVHRWQDQSQGLLLEDHRLTDRDSLFALPAMLLALTPFHSTAKPLPPPVQKQLKAGGFLHRGCPVPLSGLRLLTVSHRGFDGRTHTGQLIVNKRAARPLAQSSASCTGCTSRSATWTSPTSTDRAASAPMT